MDPLPDLPRPSPTGDGRFCIHGTSIAVGGKGLLLLGASGSGKSGVAAQMICLGATLISDDLTLLDGRGGEILAMRPEGSAPEMELRGLGIVRVDTAVPTPLAAVLFLGPGTGRLPEAEHLDLAGHVLPLLRHPPAPDLAPKAMLWLRGR